ncbi:hypothetical protein FRC02_003952 [Tulasnella sp. 418]|nr:hypothetical protein FRC02_003952 [Tulasnella sp. 418]
MWSFVHFKSRGRDEDWARQISYLERSRSTLLDITIWSSLRLDQDTYLGTSRIMEILRIVKPHTHRWRAIHIHLHPKGFRLFTDPLREATAAALETLDIDSTCVTRSLNSKWRCRIFNGGLPSLRVWKTDLQQLPPMSTIRYMDKLLDLHITDKVRRSEKSHHFKVDEILYILSRCSKLEHLSILLRSSLDPTPKSLPMTTPISLPHLVSCEVNTNEKFRVSPHFYIPILQHIKAPSLRVLDSGPIVNSIIPILATSNPFPNLESLTLIDKSWWNTETALNQYGLSTLQRAFSNLPLLNSLVLLHQPQTLYLLQILRTHCPLLTQLTLEECKFMPSECIAMVEARATSESILPLERLEVIALRNESFSEHDKSTLQSILLQFLYKSSSW